MQQQIGADDGLTFRAHPARPCWMPDRGGVPPDERLNLAVISEPGIRQTISNRLKGLGVENLNVPLHVFDLNPKVIGLGKVVRINKRRVERVG